MDISFSNHLFVIGENMAGSANIEEVKKHVRIYMMVFASLAFLTIVTVVVGYLHLPITPALIIALLIATIKGSLVASFFMHLVSEKKVIYSFLVLTVVFLLALFVLTISSFHDQSGGRIVP
jgi:cytochrome c oxidase subunit 4